MLIVAVRLGARMRPRAVFCGVGRVGFQNLAAACDQQQVRAQAAAKAAHLREQAAEKAPRVHARAVEKAQQIRVRAAEKAPGIVRLTGARRWGTGHVASTDPAPVHRHLHLATRRGGPTDPGLARLADLLRDTAHATLAPSP
jgi:hypothetical protein